MTDPDDLRAAMREAIALARSSRAPRAVNPRVGCVIVSADGAVVGRGCTGPAPGDAHAEVAALAEAGERARGATAVVTLEPCRHVGRTGPCTTALVDAGVARVVFAIADPTTDAGGGARVLELAGVHVESGLLAEEAEPVNRAWAFAAQRLRPLVTWKCAVSLDGRVAAADGGPTSITGSQARERVHELRSEVDAIIVGTGTALVDDPALTVRLPGRPAADPGPLRVVVGSRSLPATARVLDGTAPTLLLDDEDPLRVLDDLYDRGVRHALLEGGPVLASAFLRARAVDRLEWHVAPLLLGQGPVSLPAPPEGLGPWGVDVDEVEVVGEDVRVAGWIDYEQTGA